MGKTDENLKRTIAQDPRGESQQTLSNTIKSTRQERNIPRRQMREREETLPNKEEPPEIHPGITIINAPPTEQKNTTQDCNRQKRFQKEDREKTRKKDHQEQM